MLLLISTSGDEEPRFQISDEADTQLVFGIDVEGLAPGSRSPCRRGSVRIPAPQPGRASPGRVLRPGPPPPIRNVPSGRRPCRQAAHGPRRRPAIGRWRPGNLYSTPRTDRSSIRPRTKTVRIVLDKKIPPIEPPKDTKYVRHERIESALLTKFWGRPMHLGACLILPEGFDQHPEARYPLMIFHGHFPRTVSAWFRETPPDPDLAPDSSTRFGISGYNRMQQQYAYDFFKEWTGPRFPARHHHGDPARQSVFRRFLRGQFREPRPLRRRHRPRAHPVIEKKYRGIGQGWARFLYGGSTGGWEALAAQVFYPDEFNGCFAACPDPIDFRAYTAVDIYEHQNAYFDDSRWKKTPRRATGTISARIQATIQEMNQHELALGRARSGGQWDIWQAVYGPVGPDGYPVPIWDKLTGTIDRNVAEYWKEHYDLSHILSATGRRWARSSRGRSTSTSATWTTTTSTTPST